jgi:S1-C subfamily serine protease
MERRPLRPLALAAALVVFALGGAGAGAATYAYLDDGPASVVHEVTVDDPQPAATTSTSGRSIGDIADDATRSVVEITVSSAGASPFGGSQAQQAQGSGFVYDTSGHVITNQHVVDGATSVTVTFWNGATYDATVVGADSSTDLAVIRVDAPNSLLEPLALGDSSELAVGDPVIAIGSPFGLEGTVTSGIVSALHREITAPNNFSITDAIQTDAAINHGNSGGPLLDATGAVIGVNAQIESDSGGNDGVGFAIPSNTVRSVASQIIETGKAEHAYLGVGLTTLPATVARALDVPEGAEVTQVNDGTPAADAGLRAASGSRTVLGQDYPVGGDVITAVDGVRTRSSADVQAAVDAKRPGDSVRVSYTREGAERTVSITLGTRPAS